MTAASGRQMVLELPHRPALGRDDFLVAPANELAVAWIDRWPAWPKPVLLIHGPAGSGKTHLASVWRHVSGAVALDGNSLAEAEPPALLSGARAAVVDDAEAALARVPEVEQRLLHLYNILVETGGHLMLTGRTPPPQWPLRLADLRSRLAAAPAASLGPPDDQLLAAVLVKLFADRQIQVAPQVIRFAIARMERSFEGARRLVAAVDRAALARRRAITIPLVRAVLNAEGGGPESTDIDNRAGEASDGSGNCR